MRSWVNELKNYFLADESYENPEMKYFALFTLITGSIGVMLPIDSLIAKGSALFMIYSFVLFKYHDMGGKN